MPQLPRKKVKFEHKIEFRFSNFRTKYCSRILEKCHREKKCKISPLKLKNTYRKKIGH